MPAVGVEAAVVTEQMIEEEEKLKQQAEIEAQRKKEERDQVRGHVRKGRQGTGEVSWEEERDQVKYWGRN